jgi:putative membrane-bound dehydrogenase-like protein
MIYRLAFLVGALGIAISTALFADQAPPSAPPLPKVPAGFSIELVAGPPLVERPIVASFDDEGRLYVASSSGSNAPVQKQLEEKPHQIVRLEDSGGDGKFDKRTVFADHMMFPEGALFFDGSLYVSAPPSIWKLTDKDGDGVADERVEWFKGGTLTGCANDLHGPYAGPDGFIYWCKGAFAEQTHIVNGKEWKSKAAHIFRCRPDGSDFEPVMTGGMDNPVDVAFMPDGERILSGTFFHVNPRNDGLIHAVYGGVYGKEHGVLDGHPRTGELMPILDPLSAAAACGLERYDSDAFGHEYRDNLFLCQFNLRKVSRHILKPAGATYTTQDSDFVWSDFVDFHPTDVLVDADGSLLVVDTGGWYKLCCPTSQLWKPDVTGGIYRVRKVGAKTPNDPRGKKIAWPKQSVPQLWELLVDSRPFVRHRATREFVHRDTRELQAFLRDRTRQPGAELLRARFFETPEHPLRVDMHVNELLPKKAANKDVLLSRVWALSQLSLDDARHIIEQFAAFGDDEAVRHVALQAISLTRDDKWVLLADPLDDTPGNRRIAVEVLGRNHAEEPFGPARILEAAATADDRVLQHSIIYALIEIADPPRTRLGLNSESPKSVAAALIALDQMPGGDIKPADVIPHLGASDATLKQAAQWVASRHEDWGGELAQWFDGQLKALPTKSQPDAEAATNGPLQAMLITFAAHPAVQQLLANAIVHNGSPTAREVALRVMTSSHLKAPPKPWVAAIAAAITRSDSAQLPLAMAAARRFPLATAGDATASQALVSIAGDKKHPLDLRVQALSILVGKRPKISDEQFDLLVKSLSADTPVVTRSAAADAIAKASLSPKQLDALCAAVERVSPLELNRLFKPFDQSADDALGLKLVASLKKSPSVSSVRLDLLRESLAKYGPNVQQEISELESIVNVDAAAQRKRIEELLPLVATGDVRRGHAVFYSSKATCSACHRLGYAGGTIGPELTHVGKTRTERDILESILFPSLSFVRSYEPVLITTQDGKVINGVIKDETAKEYVVATGPDQLTRIAHDDIDQIQPSTVSIMPAGLDKQLTTQEVADLVAFLKNGAGH